MALPEGMSRRAIWILIGVYFSAELAFQLWLSLSSPFAKINIEKVAEALGGAITALALASVLPMLMWACFRFRAGRATTPMALWATLLFVLGYATYHGKQINLEVELEKLKANITEPQRADMAKAMLDGCVRDAKKPPGVSNGQIVSYCSCITSSVVKLITGDEIAYAAKHGKYPQSMMQKMGNAMPYCIRYLGG
jgi:hypothetical protein